jgi:hypothetical protein
MNFRGLLLLALLGLVISQDQPNIVDGKDNVVTGNGGNVVTGTGNIVNAVDPTTISGDLRKLDS